MSRQHYYATKVNEYIGSKIYTLRLGSGLSRQQLGEMIGVTHQQLQKYEKGLNAITSGRLALIANALGEKVEFFYEGFECNDSVVITTQHQRMCIELARNFMKLSNSDHQHAVSVLVKSLLKQAA